MTQGQVIRDYWARKLKATPEKDGQIPGFSEWFANSKPEHRRAAFHEMQAELRAAGLAAELDPKVWDAQDVTRQTPDYMRFRLDLRTKILDDALRPFEVAAYLEQHRPSFPQIDPREIAAYRRMDKSWQPWQGFDAEYQA